MPSQPAWFHRLEEILGALRSMTSTHLDRAGGRETLPVCASAAHGRSWRISRDLRAGKRCGGVAGGSHRASGADGLERREHELLRFRTRFAII